MLYIIVIVIIISSGNKFKFSSDVKIYENYWQQYSN